MVSYFYKLLFSLKKRMMKWYSANQLKGCKEVGKNATIKKPFTSYGLQYVTIGNSFNAGERLKIRVFDTWKNQIFHSPQIKIGNNVCIQSDCHISAINEVRIDDNVLIASFVYISDHSHGEIKLDELPQAPLERPLYSKGPIHIHKNVWLGEKVTVLPGVTIGEGAIVGAGSVVTKSIPPYTVAAGNPARVIKSL